MWDSLHCLPIWDSTLTLGSLRCFPNSRKKKKDILSFSIPILKFWKGQGVRIVRTLFNPHHLYRGDWVRQALKECTITLKYMTTLSKWSDQLLRDKSFSSQQKFVLTLTGLSTGVQILASCWSPVLELLPAHTTVW